MSLSYALIFLVVGFTLGILCPRKAHGELKIDHSNLEKDIYRLEIDNIDALDRKGRIVLRVNHNANLSQE